MKKTGIYILFLAIVVGDLIGELTGIKWMDYVFKPLFIPWIAGFFLIHSKNVEKPVKGLFLWALFFSWLGDVALMFAHINELFFKIGLGCFLIAQIFYIRLFLSTIKLKGNRLFLKIQPYWIIGYVIYGLLFYVLLFPQLDIVLRIAVFIYVVALLSMSAMALNRFGNSLSTSFLYVLIGSLLFVISDTMIAANKFLVAIPFEGLFVMVTYMSAQYMIMRGILKQYESNV